MRDLSLCQILDFKSDFSGLKSFKMHGICQLIMCLHLKSSYQSLEIRLQDFSGKISVNDRLLDFYWTTLKTLYYSVLGACLCSYMHGVKSVHFT